MARSRNIKPKFFTNEELVALPFEYRLLYIGLWTLADREGRLEDRALRIKMEIFPADNVDVQRGIDALQQAGFVIRYAVDGMAYLEIPAFAKHQNPHHKEHASTIPPRVSVSCMKSEPGASVSSTEVKPEAKPVKQGDEASDKPGADPPLQGGQTVLIPSSLIPESLQKPARSKRTAIVPDLPEWLDPEDWARFERYRLAKSGRGWTDEARVLNLRKLASLRDEGNDPKAVIDHAIAASSTGLWPIPGRGNVVPMREEWKRTESATLAKGLERGLEPRPGESTDLFRARVANDIVKRGEQLPLREQA